MIGLVYHITPEDMSAEMMLTVFQFGLQRDESGKLTENLLGEDDPTIIDLADQVSSV